MPGSTTKICTTCRASIGVASKKCKVCGGTQPYKELKQKRLEKAKRRMRESPHVLKANAVKVVDAAYVHLQNLEAAGYFSILLLGKKRGSKVKTEYLTLSENPSVQEQMVYKAILLEFENFLKAHFDRTAGATTAPSTSSVSTTSPPVSIQPTPHLSSTPPFHYTSSSFMSTQSAFTPPISSSCRSTPPTTFLSSSVSPEPLCSPFTPTYLQSTNSVPVSTPPTSSALPITPVYPPPSPSQLAYPLHTLVPPVSPPLITTQSVTSPHAPLTLIPSFSTSTALTTSASIPATSTSANLASTSGLPVSSPSSLKGKERKEEGKASEIVPSEEEKTGEERERYRRRTIKSPGAKHQKHNCTLITGVQVDTDRQEINGLLEKKEQPEPIVPTYEEEDPISFFLSSHSHHQVPICPLDLASTSSMISGNSDLNAEWNPCFDTNNVSMMEDDSSVPQHIPDVLKSTPLDLPAFESSYMKMSTFSTMELILFDNVNDLAVFDVPSADTLGFEDNTEKAL